MGKFRIITRKKISLRKLAHWVFVVQLSICIAMNNALLSFLNYSSVSFGRVIEKKVNEKPRLKFEAWISCTGMVSVF